MSAYYNEFDANAAEWLRELIKAGHIADGEVDTRSIEDVCPQDLAGYTQCHFFAGIGGWSLALRMAGWPDARPVWTGSCPCQPFSAAGKGKGTADERHLWPAFFHLIEQRRPAVVFGEQVASADGLVWLDLVRTDLEAAGYAAGAADLCAAGVGAPHIRQRLYWVAHAMHAGRPKGRAGAGRGSTAWCGCVDGMAYASSARLQGGERPGQQVDAQRQAAQRDRQAGGPADATEAGRGLIGWGGGDCAGDAGDAGAHAHVDHDAHAASPTDGFWRDADWLSCRDGKWRPVESGTFPLAHGLPARVGRLRGYGNAIVPQVAATFVMAAAQLPWPGGD